MVADGHGLRGIEKRDHRRSWGHGKNWGLL